MANFKLSIVTICRNDLVGLRATFDSIKAQHEQNFEWCVVDGGSTDGTLGFIGECGRVDRCISECDDGIYDAMHKGLEMSGGDYVLFLNSGDIFMGNRATEVALNAVQVGVDVCFFGCLVRGGGIEYIRKARPLSSAVYSVPAVQQATIYKKSVLCSFDWPFHLKITGDYYLAAELLRCRATSKISEVVLSEFSLGGASTHRYMALAREAWGVQRDVLGVSLPVRVYGWLRRVAVGTYVYIRSVRG